jgi:hypothetical protein
MFLSPQQRCWTLRHSRADSLSSLNQDAQQCPTPASVAVQNQEQVFVGKCLRARRVAHVAGPETDFGTDRSLTKCRPKD